MILSAFDERISLFGNIGVNKFQRVPDNVLEKIPDLKSLAYDTSGIRLSFYTTSKKIGIKSTQNELSKYMHMPSIAQRGYDIYINKKFVNYLAPIYGQKNFFNELEIDESNKINLIDIYFPLYGRVDEFQLVLDDNSEIKPNTYSRYEKDIVFYGSSITQGGCASRNGLSYVNMISTLLDTRVYNLGFSGKAKGEKEMAEYIATLDMSLFVYDYDHNAPSTAHLAMTHEPFYKIIRQAQPKLPIVIASRSDYEKNRKENEQNRRIIMQTYVEAMNNGDKNIYFVDGKEMFKDDEREFCTVDNTHPNSLGFYRMAKTFLKTIKEGMGE